MSDNSGIEWTDAVWNPVVGCARVSPGCENCYAERVAHRGLTERHRGLTTMGTHGPRWTGEARFVPEALAKPLHWRKPRRVFVNSMSDLFHEDITFDQIAAVFGVMAATPHLTYQVLTKRPRRMLEFMRRIGRTSCPDSDAMQAAALALGGRHVLLHDCMERMQGCATEWPLPNVWLGVSVEDQQRADERIPLLVDCPASVRFLSVEPLLGPVDLHYSAFNGADSFGTMPGIDWVIVGGESGHGARPCDVSWIRSVVDQARHAGVAVFVKQLGADPVDTPVPGYTTGIPGIRHRKGGNPLEWPEDLRVQEFPVVRGLAAVRGQEVADG